MNPSSAFVAWLVGVPIDDVMSYREIGDWPSDWPARAEYRMARLGIDSVGDAMATFRTQHFYS